MKSIYEDKSLDKSAYMILLVCTVLFPIYTLFKDNLNSKFNSEIVFKVVSLLGLLPVIHFAYNRDYYLPFLGDCVFPTGLIGNNIVPNNSDLTIYLKLEPHTKIIYWAAEPCKDHECDTPVMAWDAYKDYKNSGVVTSNSKGIATIRIRSPQHYKVPYKQTVLSPHIHYRKLLTNGMLSKIYTYKST